MFWINCCKASYLVNFTRFMFQLYHIALDKMATAARSTCRISSSVLECRNVLPLAHKSTAIDKISKILKSPDLI